jgi:hypothetical protein
MAHDDRVGIEVSLLSTVSRGHPKCLGALSDLRGCAVQSRRNPQAMAWRLAGCTESGRYQCLVPLTANKDWNSLKFGFLS